MKLLLNMMPGIDIRYNDVRPAGGRAGVSMMGCEG